MDVVPEIEKLKEKITALAEERFSSSEAPYLLSQLGKDLGEDLILIKTLPERTLTNFITTHLADVYSVIKVGAHKTIGAITPHAVCIQDPVPSSHERTADFRYHYRFWAAFSVPIKQGNRWIDLSHMSFIDDLDCPHEGYLQIPADYIPEIDLPRRDDAIKVSISKWLAANRITQTQVASHATRARRRSAASSSDISVLEAMIATLSHEQLSSTTLSLDVIAALLRATR